LRCRHAEAFQKPDGRRSNLAAVGGRNSRELDKKTKRRLISHSVTTKELLFQKKRMVGSYLGLQPKQNQPGDSSPQLGITKSGNGFLRRMLVQAAQYILGPLAPDCRLRRWGLDLSRRGGKNSKKRAVIAVARKLAVLLHKLWVTGEAYEPLYGIEAAAD
jgi:hypothetical protein